MHTPQKWVKSHPGPGSSRTGVAIWGLTKNPPRSIYGYMDLGEVKVASLLGAVSESSIAYRHFSNVA